MKPNLGGYFGDLVTQAELRGADIRAASIERLRQIYAGELRAAVRLLFADEYAALQQISEDQLPFQIDAFFVERQAVWASVMETHWWRACQAGYEFQLVNDMRGFSDLRAKLSTWVKSHVYDRATALVNNTKKMIRETVLTGNRTMRSLFADFATSRTETISYMDTQWATETGANEAAMSTGATSKTWHTQADDRVRHHHRTLEAMTLGINEIFPGNLRYPGDPNAAISQTINCRCYLTYS